MSNSSATRLRPATAADRAFLESLFFDVHRDEFASLNLPAAQLDSLLGMQARAQRESYAREFPGSVDQIVLGADDAPIGRLLIDERADRLEVVDIALLRTARGAGVGEALLRGVMARAEELGVAVRLQVRPGNRAFHLYTRLGFELRAAAMQLELEWLPAGLARVDPAAAPAPARTDWDTEVGNMFEVATDPPGQAAPLKLTRIEHSAAPGGSSFSLFFAGSMDRPIGQGTWLLRGSAEEAGRWIFLVPTGPVQGAMEYEALFTT